MTPSKLMEIKEQHSFCFCFAPHDNFTTTWLTYFQPALLCLLFTNQTN